ncbi:hypothetical protein AB205_0091650 [Aquarana catesbeiana]|uniref:Peptidase S1 domain-containing protein n=1 Tax=Aquarana catesbeiana TaxID=8400 RepID=A0A2G9QL64_AQUCT|nr:hypothetical protein AB205_0091650 [Aquarana catesbeiana]
MLDQIYYDLPCSPLATAPKRPTSKNKVFKNAQYNAQTITNDITLIKLAIPIAYTNCISPVCLPTTDDVFNDQEMCITTGWGYINATSKEIRYSTEHK